MNLESQVVNLELSQKLLTLGVKQESLFYWHNLDSIPSVICNHWFPERSGDFFVSAFTASELLEILPEEVHQYMMIIQKEWGSTFKIFYEEGLYPRDVTLHAEYNDSLPNVCAKMLIHLITNKLIEV